MASCSLYCSCLTPTGRLQAPGCTRATPNSLNSALRPLPARPQVLPSLYKARVSGKGTAGGGSCIRRSVRCQRRPLLTAAPPIAICDRRKSREAPKSSADARLSALLEHPLQRRHRAGGGSRQGPHTEPSCGLTCVGLLSGFLAKGERPVESGGMAQTPHEKRRHRASPRTTHHPPTHPPSVVLPAAGPALLGGAGGHGGWWLQWQRQQQQR